MFTNVESKYIINIVCFPENVFQYVCNFFQMKSESYWNITRYNRYNTELFFSGKVSVTPDAISKPNTPHIIVFNKCNNIFRTNFNIFVIDFIRTSATNCDDSVDAGEPRADGKYFLIDVFYFTH